MYAPDDKSDIVDIFLIDQVMKKLGGADNPDMAKKALKDMLDK